MGVLVCQALWSMRQGASLDLGDDGHIGSNNNDGTNGNSDADDGDVIGDISSADADHLLTQRHWPQR